MAGDDHGIQTADERHSSECAGRRHRELRDPSDQGRLVRNHFHLSFGRQMIANLIRWSIYNRWLVLLATVTVSAWGVWAMFRTPLDAIPDLSDVQVIIRTTYPGPAPQIVENQVTYPPATTMLPVPGAKQVGGSSSFAD